VASKKIAVLYGALALAGAIVGVGNLIDASWSAGSVILGTLFSIQAVFFAVFAVAWWRRAPN
jgi:hypothetical protein